MHPKECIHGVDEQEFCEDCEFIAEQEAQEEESNDFIPDWE